MSQEKVSVSCKSPFVLLIGHLPKSPPRGRVHAPKRRQCRWASPYWQREDHLRRLTPPDLPRPDHTLCSVDGETEPQRGILLTPVSDRAGVHTLAPDQTPSSFYCITEQAVQVLWVHPEMPGSQSRHIKPAHPQREMGHRHLKPPISHCTARLSRESALPDSLKSLGN